MDDAAADEQRAKNRKVLAALANAGDLSGVPRDVEHFVYFEDRGMLRQFVREAVSAGYRHAGDLEPHEPGGPAGAKIVSNHPMTPEIVDEHTLAILEMAVARGGDYDGWGCHTMRPQPPHAPPRRARENKPWWKFW
jgi:regulator of RNase E activity RraB